jgi:hypothetical protein
MSWFPCLVLLVDTEETLIAKTVNDIPNGATFRVLKKRINEENS